MKSVTVEYLDDMNMADPPEEEPAVLGQVRQRNREEGIKKERYFPCLEWYITRLIFSLAALIVPIE